MAARSGQKILRRAFDLGVIIKGLDGLLETIAGFLLLVVSHDKLERLVTALTQYRLYRDPDDWIGLAIERGFGHLSSGTKTFAAIYLLSHGLIKVFLVAALLRNKIWSYPVAMALLTVLILYQFYRLTMHFSLALLLFTVVDLGIAALIGIQYRDAKRRQQNSRRDAGPRGSRRAPN